MLAVDALPRTDQGASRQRIRCVGFEAVAWFNGGLFDDGAALPLEKSDIETVLAAADLDWSEIDPSTLGSGSGRRRRSQPSWNAQKPPGRAQRG